MADRPRALWAQDAAGKVHLWPHPGQWRALRSERRFVWMLAGTQGGKTSLGPVWLEREMRRCGPGDYIAVTSTFPLLKLKMLPAFLRYFQGALHLGEWRAGDKVFEVTSGPAAPSRVIFGSAVNPESLESATAKAAWLDECGQEDFRLGSYEAIQRRLSLHTGRILGTTTPYNLGWLKQQVVDQYQAGDPTHDVIQFESVVNPVFPTEEFERMRASLPSWKFDLFYRARFAKPAGLIYQDFVDLYREDGGHKVHAFELPASWPRFGGLDFGGVNTARLLVAHDPEANIYYLYAESLEGGLTTAQHAAKAKAATAGTNTRQWWGGAPSEDQWRRDLGAGGLVVNAPPISDVEAGLDRVTALFKAYRLYVFDTCPGTLDELGSYAYKATEQGDVVQPLQINNKHSYHRLDALRYLCAGLSQHTPYVEPISVPHVSAWNV